VGGGGSCSTVSKNMKTSKHVCSLFAGQMFALSLWNAQVFHETINYVGVLVGI